MSHIEVRIACCPHCSTSFTATELRGAARQPAKGFFSPAPEGFVHLACPSCDGRMRVVVELLTGPVFADSAEYRALFPDTDAEPVSEPRRRAGNDAWRRVATAALATSIALTLAAFFWALLKARGWSP